MHKLFVLTPREEWIVDRMYQDWISDPINRLITTEDIDEASAIWLLADWCWDQIPIEKYHGKHVITTVHHIVPEKFNDAERHRFRIRDGLTTAYHVFNQRTYDFIRPLTSKPIHLIPYWANQNIWHQTSTKQELRKKWGIPQDVYLVGSIQRDTEGGPAGNPKREKGPEEFVDYLESLTNQRNDVAVFLGGWRRQWIIKELLGIRKLPIRIFTTDPIAKSIVNGFVETKWLSDPSIVEFPRENLFQSTPSYGFSITPGRDLGDYLPPYSDVNEFYQMLDLYVVSALHEGGPQALLECGLTQTPCISRPVGIAEQVLPAHAINEDLSKAIPEIPDVTNLMLPHGFKPYRDFFSLYL